MPLPYLTSQAPWFSFLVHPRDAEDLLRASLGSSLRQYSNNEADFLTKMSSPPPMVGGEIRFGFAPIRGELVVAMCLSHEITSKKGQRAVVSAAQLAAGRGSKVLGLGGLTAPATGGGLLLLRHLPEGVTVTNGNAYTAAVVSQNVLEASSLLAPAATRVAVVGCTGSIGVPVCRLLTDAGLDLLLIARNADRARTLLGGFAGNAVFAEDLAAVRSANIILLLTGDHPRFGDHPDAKAVFDLDGVQLVWTARTMRDQGRLLSGRRVEPAPNWLIGTVENPFSPPTSFRARRLAKKVAAGAEFVQTQFVFDLDIFERFMADVRDLGTDHRCGVIAGVGPVRSLRALDYISTKVPGIHVPDAMVRRLRGVPADRVAEEGMQICVEIIQRLDRKSVV